MSSKSNDTVLSKRDGQTQQGRMPAWLDPKKVPLDSRSLKELLEYIYAISKEINYYDHTTLTENADGNWQDLLNYNQPDFEQLYKVLKALEQNSATPPHFSLLLAFLELYKEPQRLLNDVTGRHLDFYYNDVLGLHRNDAVPDKAHVVFELKKNTAPYLLKANETKLSAGKDAKKKELIYKLTHDIIVNSSKVEQLKSLYTDASNRNHLHFAAVANSADGLGAAVDVTNPKWSAFGHADLPFAQAGFCLASDVLLMQEGERKVTVQLDVAGLPLKSLEGKGFRSLFLVSATAEKGWTAFKTVTPELQRTVSGTGELVFSVTFNVDDPAIISYDPLLHGENFETGKPILKILLNTSADEGYSFFKNASLITANITVFVTGMTSLQLENDFGVLNPKKPFHPFGPTPEADANFWIGSDEVFDKQLSRLKVNVEWKDIPAADLGVHYKGYANVSNSSFTANATFADDAGWYVENDTQELFHPKNAQVKNEHNVSVSFLFTNKTKKEWDQKIFYSADAPFTFKRSPGKTLKQEVMSKATHFSVGIIPDKDKIFYNKAKRKVVKPRFTNAVLRQGFLHLSLNRGFYFRRYREQFTKQVLDFSKGSATSIDPYNEPFAPQAQTISLDYTAETGNVSFTNTSLRNYTAAAIELFHIGPFGQMREHPYARVNTGFLSGSHVKLFPSYQSDGNFFIGLSGLLANESLCLLFQVAEGSANPDLPKADLKWSVLCDNYWKPLNNLDFIFDTTNDLLTNGVIKLVIPKEATTENTMMPTGLIWLKISILRNPDAVCQLLDVKANAAIVEFENNGNDLLHFSEPLAAGAIKKLQQPVGAIKSVAQPFASFGGHMFESNNGFYTRVSERLRHKQRAISCWDHERQLLQQFPAVYRVKCINHASPLSFEAAGNTLIVVIPDLKNQNAINPFQPRVNKNTLDEIKTWLDAHSTSWAEHHIVNPVYEPVKISVAVKLKRGFEFNYYQNEVDKVLKSFLSPWINNGDSGVKFGGKITESHIVKLIEDLEYVDYITGLQLYQSFDSGVSFSLCKHFAITSGPASILVSHTQHEVKQSS